jgi:adenylosuccinate synthase
VREGTICVIANGVVLDPEAVINEIDTLAARNISLDNRLLISENTHIVLDYHKREDQLREESLGAGKLGTTIRGIGPCYADKIGRSYAVRMGDFTDMARLAERLKTIVTYKNKIFAALYGDKPINADALIEKCRLYADRLLKYTTDTTEYLHRSVKQGKSILFEGAQGALLDIDHGTFPFVTSSNASSLGMAAGCGVPARMVDKFVGVVKAYTTRVGAGPFPTEQNNDTGQYIRDKGHEYGTTTGRPRRCGWFDAVAVSYTATIGSIDEIAVMHLDTLSGLDELKICRAYKIDDRETNFFCANAARLNFAKCVYQTLPGWNDDLSGAKKFDDLPSAARKYVGCIEEITGKPVTIIGVGPAREQTIYK